MPFELPQELIASTGVDPQALSHESVQRYNSLGDLVKGHVELQEYRGRSMALPKPSSEPTEIDKWRTEVNDKLKGYGFGLSSTTDLAPASPDAYEFNLEGADPAALAANPAVKWFRNTAHEMGMSNDKANKFLAKYAGELVPMMAEMNKANDVKMIEAQAEVDKILGDKFKDELPARREESARAIQNLTLTGTIPELPDLLEGVSKSGDGWIANKNHPGFIALLSEVARMQQQDFGGDVSSRGMSQDGVAAKAEADDIMSNPQNPKHNLYWKSDKNTVDYVNGLYQKAFPGEVPL